MRTIHVDELAVRCNTGVRGPDGDESLMTSSADLNHLKGLGAEVERPNLATTPARAGLPGDGPSVPEAAVGHHMWLAHPNPVLGFGHVSGEPALVPEAGTGPDRLSHAGRAEGGDHELLEVQRVGACAPPLSTLKHGTGMRVACPNPGPPTSPPASSPDVPAAIAGWGIAQQIWG